jgi:hypothetical protein
VSITISSRGAAYIYIRGTSGWPATPTATLNDPAATSGDEFGDAADVSPTTAVVGSPGYKAFSGAAYLYAT